MRTFEYARPATIDETIQALAADGHADPLSGGVRPLAGGTDLLTLIKADIAAPARLLDIKRLGELPREITETADGLFLGALATLSDIECHAAVRERYPALAQAAAVAAT